MGKRTAVLTLSLDNVALLPCNPSIGGSGKAALVREVDALGGEMGKNCDATLMQGMLNTRKGLLSNPYGCSWIASYTSAA